MTYPFPILLSTRPTANKYINFVLGLTPALFIYLVRRGHGSAETTWRQGFFRNYRPLGFRTICRRTLCRRGRRPWVVYPRPFQLYLGKTIVPRHLTIGRRLRGTWKQERKENTENLKTRQRSSNNKYLFLHWQFVSWHTRCLCYVPNIDLQSVTELKQTQFNFLLRSTVNICQQLYIIYSLSSSV